MGQLALSSEAPPAVSGVLCNVNIWIILSIVFYQLCFAEVSIWTILVIGTTINICYSWFGWEKCFLHRVLQEVEC